MRLRSPRAIMSRTVATTTAGLINNFLAPILSQKSAENVLEKFCLDNQNKVIYGTYNNSNLQNITLIETVGIFNPNENVNTYMFPVT